MDQLSGAMPYCVTGRDFARCTAAYGMPSFLTDCVQAMAAQTSGSATLTGVDAPVQLRGDRVSGAYFEILGVKAALGRTFAPMRINPARSG